MTVSRKNKPEPRLTQYDATAIGLVINHNKHMDCSRVIERMSPFGRKIADNILDITNNRKPRHPEAEAVARELLHQQTHA